MMFLWRGDAIQEAVAALLNSQGLEAINHGMHIEVRANRQEQVIDVLHTIAQRPCPSPERLLDRRTLTNQEKWDGVLPDRLFYAGYVSRKIDLAGAHQLITTIAATGSTPSQIPP